jgi:hypothetical protein
MLLALLLISASSITHRVVWLDPQDVLATSYGDFVYGSHNNGLICLWTLKNPNFPERIIKVLTRPAYTQGRTKLGEVGVFSSSASLSFSLLFRTSANTH